MESPFPQHTTPHQAAGRMLSDGFYAAGTTTTAEVPTIVEGEFPQQVVRYRLRELADDWSR